MKRWLCALLALLLAASGCALGESGDWYLDQALEGAREVSVLLSDPVYVSLLGGELAAAEDFPAGFDASSPLRVFRSPLPGADELRVLLGPGTGSGPAEGMSDEGWTQISRRIGLTLLNLVNGSAGQSAVVAAGIAEAAATARMPEGHENALWLVVFEQAAVGVVFTQTGEDTLTVSAVPVLYGGDADAETLPAYIETLVGATGIILSFEQVL